MPALNWSETGGLVSLLIRKTWGLGPFPLAANAWSPAAERYFGSHLIVGTPLRGRPSAENRNWRRVYWRRYRSSRT